MNAYREGNLITFQVTFHSQGWDWSQDPTTLLVDPDTVSFSWSEGLWTPPDTFVPSGSVTALTYSSATVPSVGVVAKLSEAIYATQVDVTGIESQHLGGKWVSTGDGQAEIWRYVKVRPEPF